MSRAKNSKIKIQKFNIAAEPQQFKIQNSKIKILKEVFRKTIMSAVLAALSAFPFSTLTAANVDAAANVAATANVAANAANDDDDDMPRRWAVITGMNLSCPTTADRDHNAAHDERSASFANP